MQEGSQATEAEAEGAEEGSVCSPPGEAVQDVCSPKIIMATSEAAFRDQSPDGDVGVELQEKIFPQRGHPLIERSKKLLFDEETITSQESLGTEGPVVDATSENGFLQPGEDFSASDELNGSVYKSFSLDEILKDCTSDVFHSESDDEISAPENAPSPKKKRQQKQQQQQQHSHLTEDQQEESQDHWEEISQRREPLPRERLPQHLQVLEPMLQDEENEGRNIEPRCAATANWEAENDNSNKASPGSMLVAWADNEDWWNSRRLRPLVTPPSPLSTISSSSSSSSYLRAAFSPLTALIQSRRMRRTTISTQKDAVDHREQNVDRGCNSADSFDSSVVTFKSSAMSSVSSKSPRSPPFNMLPSEPHYESQAKKVTSDKNLSSDSSHWQDKDSPAPPSQQTDAERIFPCIGSDNQPHHKILCHGVYTDPSAVNKASADNHGGFNLRVELPSTALLDASLCRSASATDTTTCQSHPVTPRSSRSKIEMAPRDTGCHQEIIIQKEGIPFYKPRFPIICHTFRGKKQKQHAPVDKDTSDACREHAREGLRECEAFMSTDGKELQNLRRNRTMPDTSLLSGVVEANRGVRPNPPGLSRDILDLQNRIALVRRRHASWPSSPLVSQAVHQSAGNDGCPPPLASPAPLARSLDGVQVRGDGDRSCDSQTPFLVPHPPLRRWNWFGERCVSEDTLESYQAPPPSPMSNQWSPNVSPPFIGPAYYSYNTPIQLWQRPIYIERSQRNENPLQVLRSLSPQISRRNIDNAPIYGPDLDNETPSSSRQESSKHPEDEMLRENITSRGNRATQTSRHKLKHSTVPLFRNVKSPATSKTAEQNLKMDTQPSNLHYSLYGPSNKASLTERLNLTPTLTGKNLPRPGVQNERSGPGTKAESNTVKDSPLKGHEQPSSYTLRVKARLRTDSNLEKVVPHFTGQIITKRKCLSRAGATLRTDFDRSTHLQSSQLPDETLQCRKGSEPQASHRWLRNENAVSIGGATLREMTAPVRPPSAKPCPASGRRDCRRGGGGPPQRKDTYIAPPSAPNLWKETEEERMNAALTPWQQDSEPTLNLVDYRSKLSASAAMTNHSGAVENIDEPSCISRKANKIKDTMQLREKEGEHEQQNTKHSSKQAILSIKRLLASMDEKREKARERCRTIVTERSRRKQRKKEKPGETSMAPARVSRDPARGKGIGNKTSCSRTSSKSRKLSKSKVAWTKKESLHIHLPGTRLVQKASNDTSHLESSDHAKVSKPLPLESVAKRRKIDRKASASEGCSKTQRQRTEAQIKYPDILQLAGRLNTFLKYARRTDENTSRRSATRSGRRSNYSKRSRLRETRSERLSQLLVRDKYRKRKRRRNKTMDNKAKDSTSPGQEQTPQKDDSETICESNDSAASPLSPQSSQEPPICQESGECAESSSCITSIIDILVSNYQKDDQQISETSDTARKDGMREIQGSNEETNGESEGSLTSITSRSSKPFISPAVTDPNSLSMKLIDQSPMPTQPAQKDVTAAASNQEDKEKPSIAVLDPEQEELVQTFMTKVMETFKHKKKKKKKEPKGNKIITGAPESPCKKDTDAKTAIKNRVVNDVSTDMKFSHGENQGNRARPHVGKELQLIRNKGKTEARKIRRLRSSDEKSAGSLESLDFSRRSLPLAGFTTSSSPEVDSKLSSVPRKTSGHSLEDAEFWSSLLKAREGKKAGTIQNTSSEAPRQQLSIQTGKAKGNQASLLTATSGEKHTLGSSMIPNSKARPSLSKERSKFLSEIRMKRLLKTSGLASMPSSEKPARKKGSNVTWGYDPDLASPSAKTVTADDNRMKVEDEREAGDGKEEERIEEKGLDLADLITAGVFSLDHLCQLHPELARLVPGGLGLHPLLLPSHAHANKERLPCTKRVCSSHNGAGTQRLPGIQG